MPLLAGVQDLSLGWLSSKIWRKGSLMERACISLTLWAAVIAIRSTVLSVSSLKEALEIGSNSTPRKALRITDRSQVGGLWIWTGLCLVTALQNLAISRSSCERFSRYTLKAATCTLIVLSDNPRSILSWSNSRIPVVSLLSSPLLSNQELNFFQILP